MAKRLEQERPYTPLESSLVAGVLRKTGARPPSAAGKGASAGETRGAGRLNAILRMRVSSRDKREFEAFAARLAGALDTTLKPSNLLRAMLSVLQNAEVELAELARREPPMRRPPNDDLLGYADFEHRLVRLLDHAVRRSSPAK